MIVWLPFGDQVFFVLVFLLCTYEIVDKYVEYLLVKKVTSKSTLAIFLSLSPSLPGLQNINKAVSLSGLTLGAGLSLTQVKDILADVVSRLPKERTQMYHALLKHLRTLAGQQIRNMAVGSLHLILGGERWH